MEILWMRLGGTARRKYVGIHDGMLDSNIYPNIAASLDLTMRITLCIYHACIRSYIDHDTSVIAATGWPQKAHW